ncbi:RNA polymerase sporulation sigma factor SigK [Eubacteriales bacterium OttesenSCG-928-K08]|nr:RNA polymerase sporulation sigma factor SigK [Eubacteriales bacterium OttesenSCG-928-K08]
MLGTFLEFFREVFFFAAYVNGQNSFPEPLSGEDEKKYLLLYSQGDEVAKEKLIEHNLRLVAHISKKYTVGGRNSDDLISIGTIGLIKGVMTYNIDKETALATYCARCVENEILMSLRKERRQVPEISLNDAIGTDRDGNTISIAEVLKSDAPMVDDEVERMLAAETVRKFIRKHLNERERMVIEMRYGLTGKVSLTQREIARLMDISRSYVSRIEKKALIKLNEAFAKEEREKE